MKKQLLLISSLLFSVAMFAQQSLEVTFPAKSFNECYGTTSINELSNIQFQQNNATFSFNQNVDVQIITIAGVEVLSITNTSQVDASILPKGLYLLVIKQDNSITRKKIQL